MDRRFFLRFMWILLLASCNLPVAAAGTPVPSARPLEVLPTVTSQPQSTARPARTQYILDAVIDYDRHFITVDETITYQNESGVSLGSLTFAMAANLWPNCFSLKSIKVDGVSLTKYALAAQRLDIPLSSPLEPDALTKIELQYTLSLPYMDQASSLRARIFGYSDIQMNLVNWYPFLVPNVNGEWIIREPWSHGEYLIYPLADFEVNLVFKDPEHAPVVAASGTAEQIGGFTRYTLDDGRAFALSASHNFQVSNMKVGDITVYSYYLPIYRNAGEAAMYASAQAIQVFSQKFGPYPHKSLSVVLADFKDSMEFSGLYFHSRSFYDLYDGSPANYLTFVAVHETAHQWWFGGVASDQALEPWLDESLATYSEAIYYETSHPDLLSYWWSNRINFFQPQGDIDLPVYNYQNDDVYKHAVYFNGASFLQELRDRIGDQAFMGFLQDYYMQGRGEIADSDDFFLVLDAHTDVDYSDIVRAYFKSR
jgi:aminopeptidase N